MAFRDFFLARYRWLHLAHSGSQSQRTLWFILPAHGASHKINTDTTKVKEKQYSPELNIEVQVVEPFWV